MHPTLESEGLSAHPPCFLLVMQPQIVTQVSLGLCFAISLPWAFRRVVSEVTALHWCLLHRWHWCWSEVSLGTPLFQGVIAMGTRRPVTSTQLCLLPARGHMEVYVTTAGTTLKARTVSDVSCTISRTDDQELPFRRPVSVSSTFWDAGHLPSITPCLLW